MIEIGFVHRRKLGAEPEPERALRRVLLEGLRSRDARSQAGERISRARDV